VTLADAIDAGGFDPDRYLVDWMTLVMAAIAAASLLVLLLAVVPVGYRRPIDRSVSDQLDRPAGPYSDPVTIPILEVGPGRHREPRVKTIYGAAAMAEYLESTRDGAQ